jgi:hypothetical protein
VIQACPVGTYSVTNIQCIGCPPGSFNSMTNQSTCVSCAGSSHYQSSMGQTQCFNCPNGSFTTDQIHCVTCPSTQILVNGSTCQDCSPGFQVNDGTCMACINGRYASTSGQSTCAICPSGSYSTATSGSTSCTSCASVSGVICEGGTVTNQDGQYLVVTDNGQVQTTVSCPSGYCLEGQQCGPNRKPYVINPLCGQCLDGYTEVNGSCVSCESTNGGLVVLFLVSFSTRRSASLRAEPT